jgi:hypothetical protein
MAEYCINVFVKEIGLSHCKLKASSAKYIYLLNVGGGNMLRIFLNVITLSVAD